KFIFIFEFINGILKNPENYFNDYVKSVFAEYEQEVRIAKNTQQDFPQFPEALILDFIDNTWRDTAKSVFNNWLGKIYQITHQDRRIPFMDGIDPDNPLNL
ncbi:MAG: hypothetical protein RLZZ384_765, partial [Pseudomonadota bacterium]